MTTYLSVGKNFANWTPIFANWIQSANVCQLEISEKQIVADQSASWQLAKPDLLPTETTDCFYRIIHLFSVGENSPSYYVGEGTDVPSDLRGGFCDGLIGMAGLAGVSSILALDLGTQTGWALLGRDGSISSGTEGFKPHRFEGGGMRYLRFKRWLTELKHAADGLNAVFFEEVRRHAGVDAAHVYGGFMAHLTAWCEHHQIPYQGVPVGTIKKHATGRGNASKGDVIAAMRAKGHPVTDDNEADALALLHWTMTQGEL